MTLFYDIQTLFVRGLTKIFRNPILLFVNLFQPLLFLLLFSQLLQKLSIIAALPGSYLAYLTPGILVLNATFGAIQSGMSIVNDINSGVLQKILLTPASRAAILLGRLMADISRMVMQSLIIIGLALLLGLNIAYGFPGLLLILVTMAFFTFAWSGLNLAVGLKTQSPETLSAMTNMLVFVLLFVSSTLFPTSIMPLWAKTFSDYNPLSYASNATRELVQGGLTWSSFASDYAVIALTGIVFFTATLYQFRKIVR
jgi:ABC-2 type transport system permease protein